MKKRTQKLIKSIKKFLSGIFDESNVAFAAVAVFAILVAGCQTAKPEKIATSGVKVDDSPGRVHTPFGSYSQDEFALQTK